MTLVDENVEYRAYVPEGFEGDVVDDVDALKRAYALLDEEGRWVTGAWFRNEHPEVDPDDPFCNSWAACVDGALLLVTTGVRRWRRGDDRGPTLQLPEWFCPILEGDEEHWGDHELRVHRPREAAIAEEARKRLVQVAETRYVMPSAVTSTSPAGVKIYAYNDSRVQTREEALAWITAAIELAEAAQR